MPIWSADANTESVLSGFTAELAKDTVSKGTFKDDLAAIASANGVNLCPYISVSGGETLGTALRIGGCAIDLPSWRASLLSASTVNSPIVEISVIHCTLTPQHLLDLAQALEKIANLQVLKLDYIQMSGLDEGATLASVLKPFVWGAAAPVEYLSLKGNGLGDDFCLDPSIYSALSGNYSLQSLSLADNGITDAGAAQMLKAARLSLGLRELCLAKNRLRGDTALFSAISDLLAGTGPVSAEDETTWKNAAKVVGDRNKALKDVNKKRKKAGQVELPDVATPAERIAKVEGGLAIANRTITALDLSFNPWDSEEQAAGAAGAGLLACLAELRGPCRLPGAPALRLRVELRGSDKTPMGLALGAAGGGEAGAEAEAGAEGVVLVV